MPSATTGKIASKLKLMSPYKPIKVAHLCSQSQKSSRLKKPFEHKIEKKKTFLTTSNLQKNISQTQKLNQKTYLEKERKKSSTQAYSQLKTVKE